MDKGKVVLGALAGLAAGAILGILFAPEKGSDTRKKIASKGKDTAEGLKEKYNGIIDNLNSKLESVKKGSQNYYDEGKEVVDNAKSKFEGTV